MNNKATNGATPQFLTRRRLLALAAPSAGLAVMVGCSSPGQPSLFAATGGASEDTPAHVLRIGIAADPGSLAAFPDGRPNRAVVQNLVFSSLVGLDDQLRPFPDLAESVPTLANGGAEYVGSGADRRLQTTFRLREGVRWSDGAPLTSRDVKFTHDLVVNPRSGAIADLEAKYERVETPDDRTIVFTMHSERSARALASQNPELFGSWEAQRGPVLDPLYGFGVLASFILPAHVLGPIVGADPRTSTELPDAIDRSAFARQPVGSGPYAVESWEDGGPIELRARADYFGGTPRIETIRVSFGRGPNAGSALAEALEKGDLDLVAGGALDLAGTVRLASAPDLRVHQTLGTTWEKLAFNLDDPALEDRRIRQAIAYALDRDEIVREAYAGQSAVVESPFARWPGALGGAARRYSPDLARARALLRSAGWSESDDPATPRANASGPLRLRLLTNDSPIRTRTALIIRARLAAVGIDVAIETVPSADLFAPERGRLARRDFTLALYAWSGATEPGLEAGYLYAGTSVPTKANGYRGGNYAGYKSAEADRLIAAGAATLDPVERGAVYRQLERLLLDDLPALPLAYVPTVSVARASLVGYAPPRGPIGDTWNAWEWDLRR